MLFSDGLDGLLSVNDRRFNFVEVSHDFGLFSRDLYLLDF